MNIASDRIPEAVDTYLGFESNQERIAWAAEMLGRGREMTDGEAAALAAVLEANQDNEDLAVELATELGAEGMLTTWAELIDPRYAYEASDVRVDALSHLQDSLGAVLGLATRSDDPRMGQWEREMIAAGDQQFGDDVTWRPYGFQLMSSLMGSGQYSTDFLSGPDGYGDALLAFEESGDPPASQWTDSAADTRTTVIGDAFRIDPMTGYMDGLARNPEAATDFFFHPVRVNYMLNTRYEEVPGLASESAAGTNGDGGVAVIDSIGDALLAATTGVGADDVTGLMPTPQFSDQLEREAQQEIFSDFADFSHGRGNDFPPELRDTAASMLGSYREAVYESAIDPNYEERSGHESDPGHRDVLMAGDQLAFMATQIARDPDAYQTLSLNMNVEYVQRLANDTTNNPDNVLDDVGRAIGFISEGRFAALEIDGEESAWYGSNSYDLLSYGVNKIPVAGPEIMALIDMGAEAWTNSENEQIRNHMSDTRQEYFDETNVYVQQLAAQWLNSHPEAWNELENERRLTEGHQTIEDGVDAGSDQARNRLEPLL